MPIQSLSSRKRCGDCEDARLLVDGDSKTNGDNSSEDPAVEIEDLDSIHEILNIFKAFICCILCPFLRDRLGGDDRSHSQFPKEAMFLDKSSSFWSENFRVAGFRSLGVKFA